MMKGGGRVRNLCIDSTACTPSVRFDAENNLLEIRGSSCPENTAEFYGPIFFWLEEYFRHLHHKAVTVNLEPEYFTSNSWKVMTGFFEILDSATSKGVSITVNWLYIYDDDMLEYGKAFQEEFVRIAFTFIQKA